MVAGLGGALAGRLLPELDVTELQRSTEAIARAIGNTPWVSEYGTMIAIFAGGLIAGWLPAWWWASRRARWQPLLLVDHRRPDMTLGALLTHLRQHSAGSEPEAMRMVVEAANQGSLSVWRRSASNAVQRMPRRFVEVALVRQAGRASVFPVPATPADLFFFRAEVRALWPESELLAFPVPIRARAH